MDAQMCRIDQLVSRASLPPVVQKWLDRALPEGLDVAASVRVEQEGEMEIRGRWAPFTATGIYEAPPLSFKWRARFQMLPGVWIVAEDGHRAGQGWGGARLWGFLPIGQRTDPEVLASQMVRTLGELPWCPSLVLAAPSLTWSEAGPLSFEVRSRAGEREVQVHFDISEQGDVVRAHSRSRLYDVPGGYAEAPWRYEFGEHREFSGVLMPATAVASFEKDGRPEEYLRAGIRSVAFEPTGR
jgi:hypothetical protein